MPARYQYPRARVTKPLALRETSSLSSPKCGTLTPGTSVLIIDEVATEHRVRVASCRAAAMLPLGWVTRGKEGEDFLTVVQDPVPIGLAEHEFSWSSRAAYMARAHEYLEQQSQLSSRQQIQSPGRGSGVDQRGYDKKTLSETLKMLAQKERDEGSAQHHKPHAHKATSHKAGNGTGKQSAQTPAQHSHESSIKRAHGSASRGRSKSSKANKAEVCSHEVTSNPSWHASILCLHAPWNRVRGSYRPWRRWRSLK